MGILLNLVQIKQNKKESSIKTTSDSASKGNNLYGVPLKAGGQWRTQTTGYISHRPNPNPNARFAIYWPGLAASFQKLPFVCYSFMLFDIIFPFHSSFDSIMKPHWSEIVLMIASYPSDLSSRQCIEKFCFVGFYIYISFVLSVCIQSQTDISESIFQKG